MGDFTLRYTWMNGPSSLMPTGLLDKQAGDNPKPEVGDHLEIGRPISQLAVFNSNLLIS